MRQNRISKGGAHIPNYERLMRQSVNYTLEEIAGTVTYYELFDAPVIYLGAYFEEPEFFNMHNDIAPGLNMSMPNWCRVKVTKGETGVRAA